MAKIDYKKTLREFSRSPLGLFLREKLNIYPPAISLRYSEVSSDLFIWRDPNDWDTYFNLTHLGPILNPNYQDSYEALIEFYDAHGKLLGDAKVPLIYGVNALTDIINLSSGKCTLGNSGTFAVFHLADKHAFFGDAKICIAERGFVSYKKRVDQSMLRSYAHGNANAIAYSMDNHKSRCLGVLQKSMHYFRCQLTLQDAVSSEIALVNFLDTDAEVGVYQYKNNTKEKLTHITIHAGGLALLKSGLDFDATCLLEFESRINFLRPVIFKHYQNHFDVLHG
jgi:hypothetical protein